MTRYKKRPAPHVVGPDDELIEHLAIRMAFGGVNKAELLSHLASIARYLESFPQDEREQRLREFSALSEAQQQQLLDGGGDR